MSSTPTTKPSRVVIEDVEPHVAGGDFYAKRVVGEPISVKAAVFADGHQEISADLLWRESGREKWRRVPMEPLGNDEWGAEFSGERVGFYEFTIEGWINEYKTWLHDLEKRKGAGQSLMVEYEIGREMLEEVLGKAAKKDKTFLQACLKQIEKEKDPYTLFLDSKLSEIMRQYPHERNLTRFPGIFGVRCQRRKALFSTWYELFPRSFGGFKGVVKEIPNIAKMGFDVLYLPPVHPIGRKNRKGKNNNPQASKDDPGSPWAIGSKAGGHDALHARLGSQKDLQALIEQARKSDMEIALDLALQCSPDHPYITEHPEWFKWRPDSTIQYAENPPKKYEDIVPINFDTEDWQSLWEEIARVVLYWVGKGVRIFRVDNPHTKPFAFWRWLIGQVHENDPEVIFLSEAFTRPHVMQQLAKVGFDQSYTYFTWRNTKWELVQYMAELTASPLRDFFRPNFWPNTPDILPEYLQHGGRPAFVARLVLAATLSSNYGIYGPAFELCVSDAVPGKEEYLNSEKYEAKAWKRNAERPFCELISLVNAIRKENEAFQTTWNLQFCETDNDMLIGYAKFPDFIVVVNLDPYNTQSGTLQVPLEKLGLAEEQPFLVHDLLSNKKYIWNGRPQYIELNPHQMPAHIFRVHAQVHKEQDFDYFM